MRLLSSCGDCKACRVTECVRTQSFWWCPGLHPPSCGRNFTPARLRRSLEMGWNQMQIRAVLSELQRRGIPNCVARTVNWCITISDSRLDESRLVEVIDHVTSWVHSCAQINDMQNALHDAICPAASLCKWLFDALHMWSSTRYTCCNTELVATSRWHADVLDRACRPSAVGSFLEAAGRMHEAFEQLRSQRRSGDVTDVTDPVQTQMQVLQDQMQRLVRSGLQECNAPCRLCSTSCTLVVGAVRMA